MNAPLFKTQATDQKQLFNEEEVARHNLSPDEQKSMSNAYDTFVLVTAGFGVPACPPGEDALAWSVRAAGKS
jgi:hypothetical protein